MPCYRPLAGWRARISGASGKRGIVFSASQGFLDLPIQVACGACIGCRIDRSQQWAVRCVHEAQLHDMNCYVTLTYDDEHLPEGGKLVHRHFQLFMKRLRKHFRGKRIGYFQCGEYGEELGRPHYHALLFGVDFADKTPWKKNANGDQVYLSPLLQRLWGQGFTSLGSCTFQSAAYCARYVMKKVTGERALRHYERVDPDTGEVHELPPEYLRMSLRPAVGKRWVDRYQEDVFPDDFVVVEGKRRKVPRYYDKRLELVDEEAHRAVKRARVERANTSDARHESSPGRLAVREEVKSAQVGLLKRSLR